MTLRLVADNVETLPIGNLMDLGGMARELGKRFDAGEFGDVATVVTLVAGAEGLSIHSWGDAPNGYELMGIFECAKLQCFASDEAE